MHGAVGGGPLGAAARQKGPNRGPNEAQIGRAARGKAAQAKHALRGLAEPPYLGASPHQRAGAGAACWCCCRGVRRTGGGLNHNPRALGGPRSDPKRGSPDQVRRPGCQPAMTRWAIWGHAGPGTAAHMHALGSMEDHNGRGRPAHWRDIRPRSDRDRSGPSGPPGWWNPTGPCCNRLGNRARHFPYSPTLVCALRPPFHSIAPFPSVTYVPLR